MITCHTTEDERWTPMKHIIFASSSKIERAFLLSLIPTPPLSQETTVFFPQQGHLKFDRMFHVPTFKARGLEAKSKSGSMMSLSPGKMPWPNELTIVSTLDAQINQSWVCWVCVVTVSDFMCSVLSTHNTCRLKRCKSVAGMGLFSNQRKYNYHSIFFIEIWCFFSLAKAWCWILSLKMLQIMLKGL